MIEIKSYSDLKHFFNYDGYPEKLQKTLKPLCELAEKINKHLPEGDDKLAGFKKLIQVQNNLIMSYSRNLSTVKNILKDEPT